jgi:putative membrane protein
MRTLSVAVVLLGAQAFAATKLAGSDRQFLTQALAGARGDGKLGELAVHRGIDPQVKALGRRMIDDSDRTERQLPALARRKGVSLSPRMDDRDAVLYRRLSRIARDRFDHNFLAAMSERQQRTIRAFETAAGTARDPEVRRWAANGEMMRRAHRDLANDARRHL